MSNLVPSSLQWYVNTGFVRWHDLLVVCFVGSRTLIGIYSVTLMSMFILTAKLLSDSLNAQ